jgi:hypothetical protein
MTLTPSVRKPRRRRPPRRSARPRRRLLANLKLVSMGDKDCCDILFHATPAVSGIWKCIRYHPVD